MWQCNYGVYAVILQYIHVLYKTFCVLSTLTIQSTMIKKKQLVKNYHFPVLILKK